jgi:hypothetical protein
MPRAKACLSGRVGRRPSAARACALTALFWAAFAAPTAARPQPDLAELDLRVRPADVAAPKRPKLAEPLAPVPAPPATATPSDVVEEVDRVGRGEIPSRLSAGSGGDGGVLEELLEDNTIPLFRVRVKPPF